MLNKLSILAASAAVLALATTGANAAAFVAGSFAFNGSTSTTSNVLSTTSFANASGDIIPGTDTGSFSSVTLPATLATGNPYNFATASGFNFSDAGLGTFTATSATLLGTSTAGPSSTASWAVVGTFTIGSDFSNAGTVLTADETISLTQTNGAGNAISFSGTFQSPENLGVPEPITISLFGAGLAGLGFGSRRRKAATKA
jgi:PEP-CTERM motif-containing protein